MINQNYWGFFNCLIVPCKSGYEEIASELFCVLEGRDDKQAIGRKPSGSIKLIKHILKPTRILTAPFLFANPAISKIQKV